MSITQQDADQNLDKWKNLGAKDRDKIIYDALFSGELGENTPMFSRNIKDQSATNALMSKLSDRGVAGIICESLPRSTLAITSWNGVVLPPMPDNKGIAYFGYLVTLQNS